MSGGAPDPAAALATVQIIRHMTPDQRASLWQAGAKQKFERGDCLINAGDQSDFVLVLLSGSVEIIRPGSTIAPPLRLDAPLLTGEIAAYAGTARTATVRAATSVHALRLDRTVFMDAVRHCASAGQALTELVASRICAPDSITRIGRFSIEGLAGRGGSGCVFKAREESSGQRIALKMLSHALALLPGAADDFFREAALLARLDHPSVIRVLETFPAYDTCFIAMPWIDGVSLRRRMDAGESFAADDVRRWTQQMLGAIHALEQAGVVHCDINPSNILIDDARQALLIDLGAGCFHGAGRRDGRTFHGSPLYASPEQIMGRAPDSRSDIYNLCCTLYELVFGDPPFGGDSLEAIFDGHLRASPVFDNAQMRVVMNDEFIAWLRTGMSRTRSRRPTASQSLTTLFGHNQAAPRTPLESP